MRGRDQDEAGPGLSHTNITRPCTHTATGYTLYTVYSLYKYTTAVILPLRSKNGAVADSKYTSPHVEHWLENFTYSLVSAKLAKINE